jgi:hypothetical protein
MNRHELLQRAIRRNKGRLIQSDWLLSLSAATGLELCANNLIDVDVTVAIRDRFFAKLRDDRTLARRFWPREALDELTSYLAAGADRLKEEPVVLFSSVDHLIGSLELPANAVLRHAEAVWKAVQNDLTMTTRNLEHGMCLEESMYSSSGEYVERGPYELATWGAFSEKHSTKEVD